MESRSLRSSEWFLVGSFLLILSSLVLISQVNRWRNTAQIAPLPSVEKVPVAITGAVAKPDTYWVWPGVSLQTVLKKSRPKRFANLRSLDLKSRVEGPLEIHLEELKEIAIRIEGAVLKSGEYRFAPGTRLSDLKSKIQPAPDADLSLFKKRRLLRDGEVLEVGKQGG